MTASMTQPLIAAMTESLTESTIEKKPTTKGKTTKLLCFDGGGSRGVIQVQILSDLLKAASFLRRRPRRLTPVLKSPAMRCAKNRAELRAMLDEGETDKEADNDADKDSDNDPDNDSDSASSIFDMIVGTSTGALIAFALVGGVEIKGRRFPMPCNAIQRMYARAMPLTFSRPASSRWRPWVLLDNAAQRLLGWRLAPLPLSGVDSINAAMYRNALLSDFPRRCVAGAVALKLRACVGQADEPTLFDTASVGDAAWRVADVLRACCDAPILFETPVHLGVDSYVDGALGSNCPVEAALKRLKEDGADNLLVISIAAPPGSIAESSDSTMAPPNFSVVPKSGVAQIRFWVSWILNSVVDGDEVFRRAKENNEGMFLRLRPHSERVAAFPIDTVDATSMISAIRDESLQDARYFEDVLAAAAVLTIHSGQAATAEVRGCVVRLATALAEAGRSKEAEEVAAVVLKFMEDSDVDDDVDDRFQLLRILGFCAATRGRNREALRKYDVALSEVVDDSNNNDQLQGIENEASLLQIRIERAACLQRKGHLSEAMTEFKSCLQIVNGSVKITQEERTPSPHQRINVEKETEAWCHQMMGDCLREMGDLDQALDHTRRSVEILGRVCRFDQDAMVQKISCKNLCCKFMIDDVAARCSPAQADGETSAFLRVYMDLASCYNSLAMCYLEMAKEGSFSAFSATSDKISTSDKVGSSLTFDAVAFSDKVASSNTSGKFLTSATSDEVAIPAIAFAIDALLTAGAIVFSVIGFDADHPALSCLFNNMGVAILDRAAISAAANSDTAAAAAALLIGQSLTANRRWSNDEVDATVAVNLRNLARAATGSGRVYEASTLKKMAEAIEKRLRG